MIVDSGQFCILCLSAVDRN